MVYFLISFIAPSVSASHLITGRMLEPFTSITYATRVASPRSAFPKLSRRLIPTLRTTRCPLAGTHWWALLLRSRSLFVPHFEIICSCVEKIYVLRMCCLYYKHTLKSTVFATLFALIYRFWPVRFESITSSAGKACCTTGCRDIGLEGVAAALRSLPQSPWMLHTHTDAHLYRTSVSFLLHVSHIFMGLWLKPRLYYILVCSTVKLLQLEQQPRGIFNISNSICVGKQVCKNFLKSAFNRHAYSYKSCVMCCFIISLCVIYCYLLF